MHILLVHNILNDSLSVSGVLKEYALMANAWNASGQVADFVVAKAGSPQLRRLSPNCHLLNSDGFFDGTRHLSKAWISFPAYAFRMLSAHFLKLPKRYDIVYATSPFVVEVYSAMVLAKRQKAKLVVKVQHLLAAQSHRHGLINRLLLRSERISTKWINHHADLVFCLSETVGRDYRQYERDLGLTPRQTIASGCGVDLSHFSESSPAPAQFDAVILGRIHELKGVREIPQVWKSVLERIPSARLLVIGEGPHRGQVEQACRDLQMEASITFTGGIPELEKNKLLGQAKLGVSLSYEEGWGLSVTEFLAAGLPVVAYDLPVFKEVFPGQLTIVPPHNHGVMADQIVQLLKNDQLRAELAQRGREFIRRYDYRSIAQSELTKLSTLLEAATIRTESSRKR